MLSLGLGVTSSLTSVDALVRGLYSAGGVLPRVVLDFDDNNYVLNSGPASFNKAFMGTSPKLTYSTTSNSTMVNSAGNIVWAPHNLLDYSEDFTQSVFIKDPDVQIGTTNNDDPAGGQTATQINVSGSGRIYANVTSGDYFTSVYLKPGTFSNFRIAGFFIDLGVTPPTNSSTGGSIDVLPNNWFRVTVGPFVTARPFQIQAYPDDTYAVHTQTGDYQIWGAHVYRSDLGGMAQVPGAATGFETYVPTSGNAEYLPRVGHHVYNGSAWVNEGLLIESEPRTNLIPDSNDPTTVNWFTKNTNASQNLTGPDGVANSGWTLEDDNDSAYLQNRVDITISATTAVYTGSVFVLKDDDETRFPEFQLQATGGTQNIYFVQFNSATGATVVRQNVGGSNINVEDYGDWWRFSFAVENNGGNTTLSFKILPATGSTWNTNSTSAVGSIGFYGAQLEQGQVVNGTPVDAPTPSSYMPTNGGTYTRSAQSLTVPPAEFGWPEPEYIGPELVENVDFSTYADQTAFDVDWTRGTGWTFSGGVAVATNVTPPDYLTQANAGLIDGSVYVVTFTISNYVSGRCNIQLGAAGQVGPNIEGNGTYSVIRQAALSGSDEIRVQAFSNFTANIDNISVREINPLSVSIQMDGRMTYADTNVVTEVIPWYWFTSSTVQIFPRLNTAGGTGKISWLQNTNYVETDGSYYTPGINVPFNIASRHGSTFINAAVDGVALTADTTPTALPDLSGTNLQIAYDFMGTIGQFRQFAGDIGDTGLVTATNPSTEPTLSLTFDGTEGSFYNFNWSE